MAELASQERDRAFERIYRKHAGDVYRYALAVLRDPTDAEDVTQTTFLNAFRALKRGENPRKTKSWLIAIAHNVCLQRFRQAARRPDEVAFDDDVAEAIVKEDSPSAEDIQRALGQLSFNQRSALVMRELEGRSYAEIAEVLGVSTSAVETLLFRARRALREQLEGELTCEQAELALSKQLDGRLPRSERGALRAHLRACPECARAARSQRAQRSAWKAFAAIPLPTSLTSLFGGGTAAGTAVAVKVATMGAAAALVGGGTYVGVEQATSHPVHAKKAQPIAAAAPRLSQRPAPAPPAVSTIAIGLPATAPPAKKAKVKPKPPVAHANNAQDSAAAKRHGPPPTAGAKGPPSVVPPEKAGNGNGNGNANNANANANNANANNTNANNANGQAHRATPTPGQPAHGTTGAPGQVKPKTHADNGRRAGATKPSTNPATQAKKKKKKKRPIRPQPPVHAAKKANPGKGKPQPTQPSAGQPPPPPPAAPADQSGGGPSDTPPGQAKKP